MVISLGWPLHAALKALIRWPLVQHTCSVLPSLVVPGLVGPFARVVIAADAGLDACVWAGKGRGGQRPASSRTFGVVGGLRVAVVGAVAVVGYDGCGLVVELLVVSLCSG